LLRAGRLKTESPPRQCVDPLRVGQRSLLEPKLAVPLLENRPLALKLLDPISVVDAIKMLPGVKEHEEEGQEAQSEQAITLPAFLLVDFAPQARVVNALYVIRLRETRAASRGPVSQPPCSGYW